MNVRRYLLALDMAPLSLPRGLDLGLVAVLVSVALSACGSAPARAPGTASVVSAPVRIAHTRLGAVGYRVVGTGPPLVLIMGYAGTIEDWDPRLVHALAAHHRVVMFDNSGVGDTQQLPQPFSIDAMADQVSALIDTLGLGRPDVLGWSMGGMTAQAVAVLHPAQVSRLILCATYPGTGQAVVPSAAVIPGARLVLYPDAGHAFLFQDWSPFASLVNSFLTSHPTTKG